MPKPPTPITPRSSNSCRRCPTGNALAASVPGLSAVAGNVAELTSITEEGSPALLTPATMQVLVRDRLLGRKRRAHARKPMLAGGLESLPSTSMPLLMPHRLHQGRFARSTAALRSPCTGRAVFTGAERFNALLRLLRLGAATGACA